MSLESFKNGDGVALDTDFVVGTTEVEISKSKTNGQLALSFTVGVKSKEIGIGNLGSGGKIDFYGKISGYWTPIKLDLDIESDFPLRTIKNQGISAYKMVLKKGSGADFAIIVRVVEKISIA